MAVAGGRYGFHITGAARLHARRDRLAQPASHVSPAARGLSFSFEFARFFRESADAFYDSLQGMDATAQDAVPDDIGALRAALTAALARAEDEAARAALVEAELAVARAKASDDAALIAHPDLTIRKLQRALHGQSSERSARLHDQMELTFEELESTATEDEIAAEQAAARTTEVAPCAQTTGAPAISRASAARTRGRAGADRLPLLRRSSAAQAG